MTGRTKISLLAGEREQVLMWRKARAFLLMTVTAFDTGKTLVKVAAVQILVNDIYYIRPPIPILLLILVFPYAFKFFKMCFHTPVILIFAWASGCIHFSPGYTSSKH